MKHTTILLATVVSILSCISCSDSDVKTEFNTTDFWNEHHAQSWDSTSTSNNLIGTWVWVYTNCCPEGNSQVGKRTENENIKLKIDREFVELSRNDTLLLKTKWFIYLKDGDLYGLQTDLSIMQVHGRILFSNNAVLFNNSYIDGANNYFLRELYRD